MWFQRLRIELFMQGFNNSVQNFINASLKSEEKLQAEKAAQLQRFRWLSAILAVVGVIAITSALLFFHSQQKAQKQARESKSRQLAAEALNITALDESLLVAIEAVNTTKEDKIVISAANESLRSILPNQPRTLVNETDSRNTQSNINTLAYSPNRKWLATGSIDQTILIWNLEDVNQKPIVLDDHSGSVISLSYSPDGKFLASASGDKTIRLWDTHNLQNEPVKLDNYLVGANVVAFSPDSKFLASGDADGEIYIYDILEPLTPPTGLDGYRFNVHSLGYSVDGTSLVSLGIDGILHILNPKNLETEPTIIKSFTNVTAYALHPIENLLAVAELDNPVQIWDLSDLENEPLTLPTQLGEITALSYNPNGDYLLAGTSDNILQLWQSSEPNHDSKVLTGHNDAISSIAFHPDLKTLASGSRDGTILLWKLENFRETEPMVLRADTTEISALAFSPDGKTLSSGSQYGGLKIWDLAQPETEPQVFYASPESTSAVAYNFESKIAASGEYRKIYTRNLSRTDSEPIKISADEEKLRKLAFSPNGQFLASTDIGSAVKLWHFNGMQFEFFVNLRGHKWPVNALQFSQDNQSLVSASDDKTICIWDLNQIQQFDNCETENNTRDLNEDLTSGIHTALRGPKQKVEAIAYHPENNILISGDSDGEILIWDLSALTNEPIAINGEELGIFGITSLTYNPVKNLLAAGVYHYNEAIFIWDLNKLENGPVTLLGHEDLVKTLIFSPDGHTLASGADDKTVRLWNLKDDRFESVTLDGHESSVIFLEYNDDGSLLASGDTDSKVKIWRTNIDEVVEIACDIAERNLSKTEWESYFQDESYRKSCQQYPEGPTVFVDTPFE